MPDAPNQSPLFSRMAGIPESLAGQFRSLGRERGSRGKELSRKDPPAGGERSKRFRIKTAVDLGALLSPKIFLYLVATTLLLLVQVYVVILIRERSKESEVLREKLRISTSISATQALKISELQSIHNMTERAKGLGLLSSAVPPVDIEP